jgi:hypothetical protein
MNNRVRIGRHMEIKFLKPGRPVKTKGFEGYG